jgi:hypothetical protein
VLPRLRHWTKRSMTSLDTTSVTSSACSRELAAVTVHLPEREREREREEREKRERGRGRERREREKRERERREKRERTD